MNFFNNLNIPEESVEAFKKLKYLLEDIQRHTEILKNVETISNDALHKLGLSRSDDFLMIPDITITIKEGESGNEKVEPDEFEAIKNRLGYDSINEGGAEWEIIYYAIFAQKYNKNVVVSWANKGCWFFIRNLYNEAKTEERKLKDLQKKIYGNLKKWCEYSKKSKAVVNKIMSKEMANGLQFDSTDKRQIHKASPNFRKFERYKQEHLRLTAKMISVKNNIEHLLKQCGVDGNVAVEVFNSMKYPMYDVGKLRELQKAN